MGESAQLRFALKNFGRNSPNLGEFRPLLSRRICWFGEISPKSKEIRPKYLGRNLTARVRPFWARKIITVYKHTNGRTKLSKKVFNNKKFVCHVLKSYKAEIQSPESLGPTWCPLYSEFWNLKSVVFLPNLAMWCSNGVRWNGVSVKWRSVKKKSVKWLFGKVIQNHNK
jgi:hypothetical protein